MELHLCTALFLLIAGVSLCGAETIGNGRDCDDLAETVHGLVMFHYKRSPLAVITKRVEGMTSIDVTDIDQLTTLACGIEGKTSAQIVEFLTTQGITRHVVRRAYGATVAFYRLFRPELERHIALMRDDVIGDMIRRAIEAFDKRGFMCIENPAVDEMMDLMGAEHFMSRPLPCDDFYQLASELAPFIIQIEPVKTVLEDIIGLNVSDSQHFGQLLCDIAGSDTYNAIVNVLTDNAILENLVRYMITQAAQEVPVQATSMAFDSNEELVKHSPWLQGMPEVLLNDIREQSRLMGALREELTKLRDGMLLAESRA